MNNNKNSALEDNIIKNLKSTLDKKAEKFTTLQFAVSSSKLAEEFHYSSTKRKQVFHCTSVGKMMTSILVFIAIEKGLITLDTKIDFILSKEMLRDLFVYNHKDYSSEVTIKHLLSHTSGVNDYFEGKTNDKTIFIEEVLNNNSKFWTPVELVEFTKLHQSALNKPSEKFHYSDTGYVLLGLILETIYKKQFHEILQEQILIPCGMENSGLSFYSENFNPKEFAPMIVNNVEVSNFLSLSCDWAGGGIFSTTEDLLLFLKMLASGKLISDESIMQMREFHYKYFSGIHYGLGLMQLHFNEFFFLLRGFPNLEGHMGITGVHAFYDPETSDCYVLNVGNTKDIAKSIRLFINLLQIIKKS